MSRITLNQSAIDDSDGYEVNIDDAGGDNKHVMIMMGIVVAMPAMMMMNFVNFSKFFLWG